MWSYMGKIDYDLLIKLRFGEEMIGPGLIRFLELTDETGSMQEACSRMEMAYSKAWKILKRGEVCVGKPLLSRVSGGKSGGCSRLTKDGHKLIESYNAFVSMVDKAADECFRDYFEN